MVKPEGISGIIKVGDISVATMKKLTELTAEELIVNHVWEHWTIDNIEYIKKTDKTEIFDERDKFYIVLTDFIFNNQTKHLGFCSPQDPFGLDYVQPVVFTKNGQVELFTE